MLKNIIISLKEKLKIIVKKIIISLKELLNHWFKI